MSGGVYLDNAATTYMEESAARCAYEAMMGRYGNASSVHEAGRRARELVNRARAQIAETLEADASEIVFTSGATEANNWVIGATAAGGGGRGHIIASAVEHDSILEPLRRLKNSGYAIDEIRPERDGRILVEGITEALRGETKLVSIMHVNNEIGNIYPIGEIVKAVRRRSGALVHTDAVQAYLKISVSVKKLGVDYLSVSAHKIHGAPGIGALYIRKGVKIRAQQVGGGQEHSLRAGTEALPAIAAFAEAVSSGHKRMKEQSARMQQLKELLLERLGALLPEIRVLGSPDAPHIISLAYPPYRSEVLVNYLDMRGIYVSKGSACKKGGRSHVLSAINCPPRLADSAIRVSISHMNTEADIEALLKGLEAAKKELAY